MLRAVYRRADMPKPRNLVGMQKDLPAAEMEALLLASIPVSPDEMRVADLIRKHVSELENNKNYNDHAATTARDELQTIWQRRPVFGIFTTINNIVSLPPGVVEGTMIGVTALTLGLPVRNCVVRMLGNGILPDLIVNATYLYATLTLGLYSGTLIGSHSYLQQLADVSQQQYGGIRFNNNTTKTVGHINPTHSPTINAICREDYIQNLLREHRHELTNNQYASNKTTNNNNINRDVDKTGSSSTLWQPQQQTINALRGALRTCMLMHDTDTTVKANGQ